VKGSWGQPKEATIGTRTRCHDTARPRQEEQKGLELVEHGEVGCAGFENKPGLHGSWRYLKRWTTKSSLSGNPGHPLARRAFVVVSQIQQRLSRWVPSRRCTVRGLCTSPSNGRGSDGDIAQGQVLEAERDSCRVLHAQTASQNAAGARNTPPTSSRNHPSWSTHLRLAAPLPDSPCQPTSLRVVLPCSFRVITDTPSRRGLSAAPGGRQSFAGHADPLGLPISTPTPAQLNRPARG
jgi:hypothetical protein